MTKKDKQYSILELYVAIYNDLTERFDFEYEQRFDSIRGIKVRMRIINVFNTIYSSLTLVLCKSEKDELP